MNTWLDVFEGLGGRRPVVVDLFNGAVRLRRQSDRLWLDVDDDKDRLRAVLPDLVVDRDVVLENQSFRLEYDSIILPIS